MKRKLVSLAFMLVFACSTSALADDGETGNGSRNQDPPPAEKTSTDTSSDFFTQILEAFYKV